jgi:hypothetical protein
LLVRLHGRRRRSGNCGRVPRIGGYSAKDLTARTVDCAPPLLQPTGNRGLPSLRSVYGRDHRRR